MSKRRFSQEVPILSAPSQTFKGVDTKTRTLSEVLNGSECLESETKCLNETPFLYWHFGKLRFWSFSQHEMVEARL